MKILSDEDIFDIVQDVYWGRPNERPTVIKAAREVARKAEQEILEQLVEWLSGDCPHEWIDYHSNEKLPTRERRHCPKCWEEIVKKAGGKE